MNALRKLVLVTAIGYTWFTTAQALPQGPVLRPAAHAAEFRIPSF